MFVVPIERWFWGEMRCPLEGAPSADGPSPAREAAAKNACVGTVAREPHTRNAPNAPIGSGGPHLGVKLAPARQARAAARNAAASAERADANTAAVPGRGRVARRAREAVTRTAGAPAARHVRQTSVLSTAAWRQSVPPSCSAISGVQEAQSTRFCLARYPGTSGTFEGLILGRREGRV